MEDMSNMNETMLATMFSGVYLVIMIVVYLYMGFCLMTIGNKQGRDDGWMGFIPIANAWYMCVLAGQSGWLFLLFFIPFVNAIFGIILWWMIAERQGKPGWLALLMLIPFVGIFVPGIIAFT